MISNSRARVVAVFAKCCRASFILSTSSKQIRVLLRWGCRYSLFPEGLLSSPLARISRIECRDNNKPPTARASGHGGGHTISGSVRLVPPAGDRRHHQKTGAMPPRACPTRKRRRRTNINYNRVRKPAAYIGRG